LGFVLAAGLQAETLTFQEGVSGYVGTADTFLAESTPGTSKGTLEAAEWDDDDPSGTGLNNYALIRFDSIFGNNPGQIPVGSQITSATLTYTIFNEGGVGELHEVLVDWDETVTYNGFGPSAGVQPGDYGDFIAYMSGGVATHTVSVTTSLVKWVLDASSNKGWIVVPTGSNGAEFRSSEYLSAPALRPILTVVINEGPPIPGLIRQPYLQQGTPTAVTIAWRTDMSVGSSTSAMFRITPC
jgi:hypothetical protein